VGAYAYVVPVLALVGGFIYFAIAFNVDASFYRWNGVSPHREWIGLQNYKDLLDDPVVRDTLVHTVLWGLITIPAMALIGFTLACLLTARVRLKPLYRLIFFIPSLLAPAVVAPMANRLLDPEGPVNDILSFVTGQDISTAWLSNPSTALYALMVVQIWEWTGFSFVLYMAALGAVEPDVFNAARIDGAATRTLMWRIAFPLCRSTHFTLAILGSIATFKTFEIVSLTTAGGPGGATELISTYIYNQSIEQFHAGYAASLSVMMLALALVVTAVQLWVYRARSTF
jgi:raffinose/stachyose/melibiose transport system permease protein